MSFEALERNNARELYEAACNRAICAAVILEDPRTPADDATRLSQEQAELAMAWLHKAVAAGFHSTRRMMRESDLADLRERDDFQKLVTELGK